MLTTEKLIDSISLHLTNTQNCQQAYFSTIDLAYANSQLQLYKNSTKHCNFNIIRGKSTGTYKRFKRGFYGLIDMPAKFQKALQYTFCFLEDKIIVSTSSESDRIS